MNSAVKSEILDSIDNVGSDINVTWSDDREQVFLARGAFTLSVYFEHSLIGYEIYDSKSPQDRLLSDTDLYDLNENADLVASMLNEIKYVLNEFIEDKITISTRVKRNVFGQNKSQFYIHLRLPNGKLENIELPCINVIDFGL